jgi:malonate decarboxylase alpha subunit
MSWTTRPVEKQRRLQAVRNCADGKLLDPGRIVEALEKIVMPGDRVVLEGDNQKQKSTMFIC